MPDLPRVTEAEWQVMAVVWDGHPTGAAEVAAALEPSTGWSARTVKTLLARLVKKGALSFEEDGKRYLYTPQVSREQVLLDQGRSLLGRLRGGDTSPLLAHFLREAELSPDDVLALKRVLDEREEGE